MEPRLEWTTLVYRHNYYDSLLVCGQVKYWLSSSHDYLCSLPQYSLQVSLIRSIRIRKMRIRYLLVHLEAELVMFLG